MCVSCLCFGFRGSSHFFLQRFSRLDDRNATWIGVLKFGRICETVIDTKLHFEGLVVK